MDIFSLITARVFDIYMQAFINMLRALFYFRRFMLITYAGYESHFGRAFFDISICADFDWPYR